MTGLYAGAERLMGMSDRARLRHANPWSGWTRFAMALPLLIAAVWSRVWIGWGALAPIALVILWIWANPRVFPPPRDFGAWMSRGVLGERVWLERDRFGVPRHHRRVANAATGFAAVGALAMLWGLVVLDPWAAILGALLAVAGKAWFCDRMVWIHADDHRHFARHPDDTAHPIRDMHTGETT